MTPHFFGHYLLSQGLLTPPQLLAAVEYQQARDTRVGQVAVEMGLMTEFDAERVNALQGVEDLLFGEAAIKLGLLDREGVAKVLAAQQDMHVRLGEAIATLGYMEREDVEDALREFGAIDRQGGGGAPLIPEGTPESRVSLALFRLAHKLLLRTWGLTNKADAVQVEQGPLWLSDRNVVIPLGPEEDDPELVAGVPHSALIAAAQPFAAEGMAPNAELLRDMLLQFGSVLAEHLASVMAEQGRRLSPGAAREIPTRFSRPENSQTVVAPFLTQQGRILVGLAL